MKLNDLQPNEGSKKNRKRVGRGLGAGQGKTAGHGIKGQNSRSGEGGHLYRQGGNLPFYRRLPFIRGEGFTPPNQKVWSEVSVEMLEKFESGSVVGVEELAKAKLVANLRNPVVVLGYGELSKALTVKVDRVTKGARGIIEAAGGKVELVNQPATE